MFKYRHDARIRSVRELKDYHWGDYSVNDADRSTPGLQALMMYRFGVWQSGLDNNLLRWFTNKIYRLWHRFIRNFYGIEIYASSHIGKRLRLAHHSGIILAADVVMGDDCLIRQGVSIGRAANWGGGKHARAPHIGNRVEIGAGAVIAGGITIGDDVVIGPNVVVLVNVPSHSIIPPAPVRIFGKPPTGDTNISHGELDN